MHFEQRSSVRNASILVACVLLPALAVGCAAGDPQFTAHAPAGFWMGLWHGAIAWVTLVISLFSDQVRVYEVHNAGGWYDFGFVLGLACISGGGAHSSRRKAVPDTHSHREWVEIGKKVERKLQREIRAWAEAEPTDDWDAVGSKAEAKLKEKLNAWADDDQGPPTP